MIDETLELPELSFYYPNPMWTDGDWIKNLILFFDGIALLVPDYMREKPFISDPAIAEGLHKKGLLKIFEPESFVDKESAQTLGDALIPIIDSGALDALDKEDSSFHTLSQSRLGYYGDPEVGEKIFESLRKRGLAKASEDGVSVPMHRLVRSLVLVLLSQILRRPGVQRGFNLQPTTDRPEIQNALRDLLGVPSMPSAGNVVSFDLTTVGIDLSAIPLDKVLDFRQQHQKGYRQYARDLRRFIWEIGSLEEADRHQALRDRKDELEERAGDLRKTARGALKSRFSFALGVAGAAWRVHAGDPIGGLLAFGLGATTAKLAQPVDAGAYSYLFEARRVFA
jgi:hypothetical protein